MKNKITNFIMSFIIGLLTLAITLIAGGIITALILGVLVLIKFLVVLL